MTTKFAQAYPDIVRLCAMLVDEDEQPGCLYVRQQHKPAMYRAGFDGRNLCGYGRSVDAALTDLNQACHEAMVAREQQRDHMARYLLGENA